MSPESMISRRLFALFLLGCLLLNYPVLCLFSLPVFLFGIPLLYLYLFAVWAFLILMIVFVTLAYAKMRSAAARRRKSFES
ncbi:MAG: hypothetical protein WAO07_20985 [Desulfobacterales bacterium]